MIRFGFVAALLVLVMAGQLVAKDAPAAKTEGAWLSSYDKAMEKAKADKKVVIADFAGSDWCPPCKALWSQILSTSEFITECSDKAVLVEVDFPRTKPLPAEETKRNQELATQYKITGFPTVIVFDSQGKELGRIVGYGGKDAFQKKLKGILAKAK